jgi:hypothetical protein
MANMRVTSGIKSILNHRENIKIFNELLEENKNNLQTPMMFEAFYLMCINNYFHNTFDITEAFFEEHKHKFVLDAKDKNRYYAEKLNLFHQWFDKNPE